MRLWTQDMVLFYWENRAMLSGDIAEVEAVGVMILFVFRMLLRVYLETPFKQHGKNRSGFREQLIK